MTHLGNIQAGGNTYNSVGVYVKESSKRDGSLDCPGERFPRGLCIGCI